MTRLRRRAIGTATGCATYRSETRVLSLMLAPYLVGTLVLVAIPALLAFALALTRYDGQRAPVFVGLDTFASALRDPVLPTAVFNSLLFIVLAVPLRMLGALGLALLLRRARAGTTSYRAAVYLPTVVPDAAYALAWLWVLNPVYGPLNLLLGALGLPQPAWLVDPAATRMGVVLMAAFQIGEGFVVLLAALQGIPRDLYDAAAVDGSSPRQAFRYVTLPLLAPWLVLLTLRDIVLSAQSTFSPAYLVTGGDPHYATTFLPLLIFQTAFDRGRFGEAAAMTVLLFLAVGAALVAIVRLLRGWGYADEV